MKVLHVIPSISIVNGGPSRAISLMEKALSALGTEDTAGKTDDDGPGSHLSSDAQPSSGAARIYVRSVRNFDVVYIHALFSFTSAAAGIIAHLRGVPYVVRPLGTLTKYGMTQRRPGLKRL